MCDLPSSLVDDDGGRMGCIMIRNDDIVSDKNYSHGCLVAVKIINESQFIEI